MSTEEIPLGFALARLRHVQHRYIQPRISALGVFRGQPRVILTVAENPGITQVELTRQVHIQPPTATRMIARMEEAGFVRREADPKDHRINRMYLTKSGEEVHQKLKRFHAQEDAEVFSALTPQEQDTLRALIKKLSDRYEELVGETRP